MNKISSFSLCHYLKSLAFFLSCRGVFRHRFHRSPVRIRTDPSGSVRPTRYLRRACCSMVCRFALKTSSLSLLSPWEWCGRRDSNPHEPLSSTDFRTVYGFRRPDAAFEAPRQVCGLDYPFTVPRKIRGLGAARLVSTPSPEEYSFRAWLGIAISGFPEFGQFCIAGFPGEHSSFLSSPLRLPIPPRPRGCRKLFYHKGQRDVIVSAVSGGCLLALSSFLALACMMLMAAASSWVLMCAA